MMLFTLSTTRRALSTTSFSSASYCIDMVKKADHASYLTGLLLPAAAKPSYFALAAFNCETSNMKSVTSDNSAGELRMHWWRERLGEIYDSPNGLDDTYLTSPILAELQPAIKNHGLTRRFLEQIVDARQRDLTITAHPDLTSLETYIQNTQVPLLKLGLECVDVRDDNADHVASHLAMSTGLANFIRAIPFLADAKIVAIPGDMLTKHRIRSNALLQPSSNPDERLRDDEAVKAAVFDLAVVGNEHAHHAREMFEKSPCPPEAKSVFVRGVEQAMFYKKLEEVGFDVRHAMIKEVGLNSLPMQMAKHRYFANCPF